jgi:hypothetical protein
MISGQGDTSLSQETSFYIWETICLQAMQKGYKNSISNLTHGTTGFWVPQHSLLFSLSLLLPTNKTFPTSVAGAYLCFHSQSGLKNPEDLIFLFVSPVHK